MDECSGATANDASGNGNTGTIYPVTLGNTTVGTCSSGVTTEMWNDGTNGKFNASLGFDGTDDYIDSGTSPSLNVVSSAFSVSLWVKLNGQPASGKIMNMISKSTLSYSGNGFGFGYDNRTGTPSFDLFKAGVTDQRVTYTLTNGVWYNIAAVQSFSGGNPSSVTYYVNGSSIGTYSNASAYQSSSGQTAYIGGKSSYADSVYMNGQIDDVRIYNYALTANQVKNIMNEGSAVRFGPASGQP